MAAKWKEPPKDALDTLTLGAADLSSLANMELLQHMPFDPVVKRTESTILDRATNQVFKVTKGAPHVIIRLIAAEYHTHTSHATDVVGGSLMTGNNPTALAGSSGPQGDNGLANGTGTYSGNVNAALIAAIESDIKQLGERGIRTLAVAKTSESGQWHFLGLLTFLDPPRPDTLQTIEDARRYGVAVKMITGALCCCIGLVSITGPHPPLVAGDHILIAKETCRRLHLGSHIMAADVLPSLDGNTRQKPPNLARDYGAMILEADGFAEVFPEHKYLIVECLRELGYKTGMTGR